MCVHVSFTEYGYALETLGRKIPNFIRGLVWGLQVAAHTCHQVTRSENQCWECWLLAWGCCNQVCLFCHCMVHRTSFHNLLLLHMLSNSPTRFGVSCLHICSPLNSNAWPYSLRQVTSLLWTCIFLLEKWEWALPFHKVEVLIEMS